MGKVYSLNSTEPSYFIANEKPRSLKYYLSAGLHHKVIGRFVTVSFFAMPTTQEQDIKPTQPRVNAKQVKSQPTETSTKSSNPIGLEKSQESSGDSKNNSAESTKKSLSPVLYSSPSEPGPIANYTHAYQDNPTLIKEMIKLSNEVLASARTVFPLDPFPDSVVLDRTTLNITKRTFFFSNDTLSIRIEDILNAKVNVGPFFGSLTIASRILSSEDHFTINNLWRKDAIHLKHMIQGYIIALHNEIEISHLNREDLIETISELGHDLNI